MNSSLGHQARLATFYYSLKLFLSISLEIKLHTQLSVQEFYEFFNDSNLF
ncbi:hypothetical protein LEP1GSC168_3376 [Leptospira santarosai str. HAI134]|uniref:Uncharacterized protein n=1 Tax=Leptospira santarosai serovar Arenal str. MAVJ 401 TaxID=1049976 RepID=M6JLN8_9LEPT|nr:hypothetical protein LEP1GSC063_3043 [Leptospira santarosai serovar Arenal str. MAVJ 401]EMO24314.1 hypothetical protein LEP1GSC168_3376 [Leptospira santarosai str. HAI134]